MKVKYKYMPHEIRNIWNLGKKLTENQYIYIKIKKGILGLKQAALLAYENLKNWLIPWGYEPIPAKVGL